MEMSAMATQELALPLVGGAINVRTISAAFSSPLQKLVDTAIDAKDFARRVRNEPKLLAELREKNDLIQRMAAPLSEAEVAEILGPIIIQYGLPDFGSDRGMRDAALGAWRKTWAKALCQVPREALELAIDRWIQMGDPDNPRRRGLRPEPADLIRLSKAKAAEIHTVAYRVKFALSNAPAERPEPTAEERQMAKDLLADIKAGRFLGPKVVPQSSGESRKAMVDRIRAAAN